MGIHASTYLSGLDRVMPTEQFDASQQSSNVGGFIWFSQVVLRMETDPASVLAGSDGTDASG